MTAGLFQPAAPVPAECAPRTLPELRIKSRCPHPAAHNCRTGSRGPHHLVKAYPLRRRLDTQTAEPLRAKLNQNQDAQNRKADTTAETPAQTPCQNAAPPVDHTFPLCEPPPDGTAARHYRKPYEMLPPPPHEPNNAEAEEPKNQTAKPQRLRPAQVYKPRALRASPCLVYSRLRFAHLLAVSFKDNDRPCTL